MTVRKCFGAIRHREWVSRGRRSGGTRRSRKFSVLSGCQARRNGLSAPLLPQSPKVLHQGFLLIIAFAAAFQVACGIESDPKESTHAQVKGEPRSLIVVIADTWRADHFHEYLGSVPLTPHLEVLSKHGVVFSDASSAADSTAPGTAAIMTGLLPRRSGVLSNGQVIQEHIPTLATYLRDRGHHTAAFLGNRVLRPGAGFERGFSTYELIEPANADRITDAAINWLSEVQDSKNPFFLWLHYMDPHGPYNPPEYFLSDLDPESFESLPDVPLLPSGDHSGRGGIPYYQWAFMPDPDRNGRSYSMRYAAEVRFFDHEMGRFVRYLRDSKILDDALLVVTSDHGEALSGDHGFYFSHDNGLTEDQLRVPLLIRYPGCDRGAVVDYPVSTLSILPTALDVLGLPRFKITDGDNLFVRQSRPVRSQKRWEAALRKGRWKVIWKRSAGFALFDLLADREEVRDMSKLRPKLFRDLRVSLQRVLEMERFAAPKGRGSQSDEDRRALEALGYL